MREKERVFLTSVKLLIRVESIKLDFKDTGNHILLSQAARGGYFEDVKLLVEVAGVKPDSTLRMQLNAGVVGY